MFEDFSQPSYGYINHSLTGCSHEGKCRLVSHQESRMMASCDPESDRAFLDTELRSKGATSDIKRLKKIVTTKTYPIALKRAAWKIIEDKNLCSKIDFSDDLALDHANFSQLSCLIEELRQNDFINFAIDHLTSSEEGHGILLQSLLKLSERFPSSRWKWIDLRRLLKIAESHEHVGFSPASTSVSALLWKFKEFAGSDQLETLKEKALNKIKSFKEKSDDTSRITALVLLHSLTIAASLPPEATVAIIGDNDLDGEQTIVQLALSFLISAASGLDIKTQPLLSRNVLDFYINSIRDATTKHFTELHGISAEILAKHIHAQNRPSLPNQSLEAQQPTGITQLADITLRDLQHLLFDKIQIGLASEASDYKTKEHLAQACLHVSLAPVLRDTISSLTDLQHALLRLCKMSSPKESGPSKDGLTLSILAIWEALSRIRPPLDAEESERRKLLQTISKKSTDSISWDQELVAEKEGAVFRRTETILDLQVTAHDSQKSYSVINRLANISLPSYRKSTAFAETCSSLWYNLSAIPTSRPVMVRDGALKALLTLISTDGNTARGNMKAKMALARIAISVNPQVAFAKSDVVIRIARHVHSALDTSESTLDVFEALLALTNLAVVPSSRDDVAKLVLVKARDYQLDDDLRIRRAATELLCNIMMSPIATDYYTGGGYDRMKIFALLGGETEDPALQFAALGALAIMSNEPEVARIMSEANTDDFKQLREILAESCTLDLEAAGSDPEVSTALLGHHFQVVARVLQFLDNASRFGYKGRFINKSLKEAMVNMNKMLLNADLAQWFAQTVGLSLTEFRSALVDVASNRM